jgi:hypothetical protein
VSGPHPLRSSVDHDIRVVSLDSVYDYGLLLDSRGVDVPLAYHPTFVRLSSLKPCFFKSLAHDLCFSNNAGAEDPGIQ